VNEIATCQWCGSIHVGICWRIAAQDYYEDGSIKRIEFVQPELVEEVKPEDDAAFRRRIQREAGPHTVNRQRIDTDIGAALDEVGSYYGLERNKL
jgi:hypothetical protein